MRCARALLVLAATMSVAWVAGAPAAALTPPQAQRSALIRSAPVAPPEATEQRTLCARPITVAAQPTPPPAQALMNLTEAWRFSTGAGQRVAVIDTGVTEHPRLPRLRAGGDYVSSGDGRSDCDAHGTLVAGIIGATRSPGDAFAGVAPDATIIAIRQSSSAYEAKDRRRENPDPAVGGGYGSVRTLASAVVRAVDLGATVINISEVACASAGAKLNDASLGAAVRYAYERDVVVVVAAGNLSQGSACAQQNPYPDPADTTGWGSVRTIASPAWYDKYVLAVGSVDATTGAPSSFSLHGPWVDVAAPGTDIVSLDSTAGSRALVNAQRSDSGSLPLLGTSFAAPYVAGTVALVRARYPKLTAAQVMERITSTAHAPGTGRDQAIGYGVVDAVAALTATLPAGNPVDPQRAQPIAAPPPQPTPDNSARNVALIGGGAAVAALIAVVALSLPHRRVRRLTEDEY